MGARFRRGDRVRDLLTGELYDVLGTSFETVLHSPTDE